MPSLTNIPVSPEQICEYLRKNVRLRNIYQAILHEQVIAQAAQDRRITVTLEEVQAEGDRLRRDLRLEKAADTIAWLKEQMLQPEQWEAGIRDRLLAEKLAESLFAKDVEKFFAQNRLDFEKILLYQIIVPYERVAKEVSYQIEEQEISFFEAAHLYDIDEQRRQKCGYEGKLFRRSLKPDIASVIFQAEIGEVVGPVQTDQGYHLLMVEEFIAAELTPEIRKETIDSMFEQWLASELNYLLHNQE